MSLFSEKEMQDTNSKRKQGKPEKEVFSTTDL